VRRLRRIAQHARETFEWLWRYWRTAPADRFGLRPGGIVKAPVCWVRGHDWAGNSICITNWTLQHCQRCGEEIAGRTGFHQIIERPDDEDDYSHAEWDDVYEWPAADGGSF
jgi:hypothetical protein